MKQIIDVWLQKYLEDWSYRQRQLQWNLRDFLLDHVAYRALSIQEGDALVMLLERRGILIHEAMVSGRRVLIYQLHVPVVYQYMSIEYIEILYPKPEKTWGWWDHIEYTITPQYTQSYEEIYAALQTKNIRLEWSYIQKVEECMHHFWVIQIPSVTVYFIDNTLIRFNTLSVWSLYGHK